MTKPPKIIHKKLGRENVFGYSDEKNNTIEIDSRLKGKLKLKIYIHEHLHLMFTDMSENMVTKKAKEMTDFLWNLHYRQVDNKKK